MAATVPLRREPARDRGLGAGLGAQVARLALVAGPLRHGSPCVPKGAGDAASWVGRLQVRAVRAVHARGVRADRRHGRRRARPGRRGEELLEDLERQAIYDTPAYQAQLRAVSTQNVGARPGIQAADPEREFVSDLCWNGERRLRRRRAPLRLAGQGLRASSQPVLFTARNGATLSGHVWATRPARPSGPGIVITNGSVQADEQMYWYAAQALAKAGYVVLTFDPQGQGQSDTLRRGARPERGLPGPDRRAPVLRRHRGRAELLLLDPASSRTCPSRSCSTGTSHAAKQARRVDAGPRRRLQPVLAALRPQARRARRALLRRRRRLLHRPVGPARRRDRRLGQPQPALAGHERRQLPARRGRLPGPSRRPHRLPQLAEGHGKPALGMSADYFLPPTPNTAAAHPSSARRRDRYEQGQKPTKEGLDCKSLASDEYSSTASTPARSSSAAARTWTSRFIPNQAFGATLRGADLIAWYTTAWFDKYVKRDPTADRAPAHQPLAPRRPGGRGRPRPRRQHVLLLPPRRAWTSRSPTAARSTARTCARAAPR